MGIVLTSCTNKKHYRDLSFGGITIGETFPDSLIKNGDFKLIDSSIPTYIGHITFNFPNSKNVLIDTKVECDIETKEVFIIQLRELQFSQVDDFYHMLVSKYGEPSIGGLKGNLSFYSRYMELYRKLKDEDTRKYGEQYIILGQWEPIGYNSIIQIYSYPIFIAKGEGKDIYIKYINEFETTKNYKKSVEDYKMKEYNRKKEKERLKKEEYIKKNEETLNQDF